MSTTLKRTSMALDLETIESLDYLSDLWHTSKAEVIRRVVKQTKEDEKKKQPKRTPVEALQWLMDNPISPEEAKEARRRIKEGRESWRDHWAEYDARH